MNTDDIFKAVAQSFLASIEAHINKLLDEKLEAFKPEPTVDISSNEFDKLIQNWLENHNITRWVNEDDLDLESAMDSWAGNNLDIASEVADYMASNFDFKDIVRDAAQELSFEVVVR